MNAIVKNNCDVYFNPYTNFFCKTGSVKKVERTFWPSCEVAHSSHLLWVDKI